MKTKNTGKQYEKLTQKVFAQIVNQESVRNIEVQHDVILQGKVTSHQIDVYWEFEVGGIQYQTIIQAKDWETKVKKEHMMAFKAILDDLPFGTKGIFVSKNGFQSGAVEVARAHGIKIYELREPVDADWADTITKVEIEMQIRSPYYKELALALDSQWLMDKEIDISSLPSGTAFHGDHEIVDQNGMHIDSVSELVKEFLRKAPDEETHFEKFFDNAFVIWQDGQLLKLKSISGDFGCRVYTDIIRIDAESIVGKILIDILGGQVHRFDKYDNLIGGLHND